ncbi:hypothetical protein EON64_02110, partial [archaeon]
MECLYLKYLLCVCRRYEKKKEEDEHNMLQGDGSSGSFGSALLKAFSQKRSSSNITSGVVIDEGGVDVAEAAKEQEHARGDWGGRFVDDEEDHV